MKYHDLEVEEIISDIWRRVSQNANLQNMHPTDIEHEVYTAIKNDPNSIYSTKKGENERRKSVIENKMNTVTDPEIWLAYNGEVSKYDDTIEELDKDLRMIVKSGVRENIAPVIGLFQDYYDVLGSAPIQLATNQTLDQWISSKAEDLGQDEIYEKLKIGDYAGELTDNYVNNSRQQILPLMAQRLNIPQNPTIGDLFGLNENKRKKLSEVLAAVKTGASTRAKSEIEDKLTNIKAGRAAADTAYNDFIKTVDDVLGALPIAPVTEESVAEELVEYSGGGTLEDIKTSEIYTTRLNELIADKVAGVQYTGVGFEDIYNRIVANVNANNTTKKEANRLFSTLNDTIKFTKESVTRELNSKISETIRTYSTYNDASKSLGTVFDADMINLIDDFLHIASEYGYAKMSGSSDADLKAIRDTDSYKKIENALIRKEASEDRQQNKMDYQGNHNVLLSDVYRAVLRDVQSGGITRTEAVKTINEINGRVGAIKRRVAKNLGRDLTSIYRNVIAGSTLDNTPLRDKSKYMIVSSGDTLLDEFDSSDGTHAEGGLGWYFEQFVEKIDVIEQPGLGKKILGFLTRNPATPTTVRKRRNSVKDLQGSIVAKHMHAAYHELGEENIIHIDEAVMLALGLAAKGNGFGKIAAKWAAVNDLNYTSSIGTIIDTYLEAADLGSGINEDAKTYTMLENDSFKWLDNYVNKKAGPTFEYKDMALDLLENAFKRAEVTTTGIPKEQLRDTKWNKEMTAIRPNKYPRETALLVALGLGAAGYALVHNKLTEKETEKFKKPEDSGVLNFWEMLKEVVLIKLLSGRHK